MTSTPSDDTQKPSQSNPAQVAEFATKLSASTGADSPEDDVANNRYLERIHQLEQALEQSLGSLIQLRSQLSEKHLLASQLAATEEVASQEQQAVAQLKIQLNSQQQAMEAQITKAQAKDQTIEELLATVETLARSQGEDLGRLKAQLWQKRTSINNSQKQLERQRVQWQTALEAQQKRVREQEAQILSVRTEAGRREVQLAVANQQIEALSERLSDRAIALKQLEASHRQTQAIVSEQKTTIATLYRQIEALESELAKQGKIQDQLQQASEELATDVSQHQARTTELERQRSALQEQILMQAQQANEYEATIRYWKDQCDIAKQPSTKRPRSQRQGQKLQPAKDKLLAEASANPSEVPIAPETPDGVQTPAPVITEMGLDAAVELALERALDGTDCVYISFDIDCIDAGFVPGTGWPEPGGLLPREALYLLGKIVQRAPICGLEVVEVSPPYDISDITSLMAARVICDTMGHLVVSGQLPRKEKPAYIHPEAQPELIAEWR